jgi:tRNA(adenine34) deaminase
MENIKNDEYWMNLAYAEAEKAFELGEIPVGVIIVKDDRVIGRGGNRVETLRDPTAHAEIIAIGAAAETTGYERLLDTMMYVTLEPCPMCAGAIVLSRIPRLVYGAVDPKMGACGSRYDICRDPALNHMVEVSAGILKDKCSCILQDFFRTRRNERRGARAVEWGGLENR